MAEKVFIPVIECPYKFEFNPERERYTEEAIRWAVKHKLFESVDAFCKTTHSLYYFPAMDNFDYDKMLLLAKLEIIGFVTDDIVEGDRSSNERTELVMRMYDFAENEVEFMAETPLEKAIVDLAPQFRRYCLDTSRDALKNLELNFNYLFRAVLMEKRLSKRKGAIPEHEYDVYRYHGVGVEMSLSVLTGVLGYVPGAPPQQIASNMSVFEMKNIAINIAILANDLASFRKEAAENSKSNAVIILKNSRKYDCWQKAIDEVVKLIDEHLKAFELVIKFIPRYGDERDKAAEDHIIFWKMMLSTFLNHSFQSKRYNFCNEFTVSK